MALRVFNEVANHALDLVDEATDVAFARSAFVIGGGGGARGVARWGAGGVAVLFAGSAEPCHCGDIEGISGFESV